MIFYYFGTKFNKTDKLWGHLGTWKIFDFIVKHRMFIEISVVK